MFSFGNFYFCLNEESETEYWNWKILPFGICFHIVRFGMVDKGEYEGKWEKSQVTWG